MASVTRNGRSPRGRTARSASPDGTGRNWLWVCALSLVVATDYKVRVRAITESASGSFDAFVLLEVAVYGLVGMYLLLSQRGLPRGLRLPTVLVAMLAYVVLVAVTLIETPYRSLAAVRVAELLVVVLLVFTAYFRATRADFHRLAHAFLVLLVLSVAVGMRFPQPAFALQEGRFTWLRIHPVTAGVFLALGLVIAAAYLLWAGVDRPGPVWRWQVYLVVAVVLGIALLATQTRGSVLAAGAAALVLLATRWTGRRRRDLVTVLVLGIAVVGLAGSARILAYLARGEDAAQLATLNSRTELWSLAADAVRQHPLLGWGVGASRGIFLEEIGLGGGHNALVNVAVDLGLIGILIWGAFLVVTWTTVRRLPRAGVSGMAVDRALLTALFVALVVNGASFEGIGALGNVACTFLLLVVAWSAVSGRTVRLAVPDPVPAAEPARRHPSS